MNRMIVDFKNATVVIWPDLEQIAIVSPFGPSSMSFDECIRKIESKKSRKRRKASGEHGARH